MVEAAAWGGVDREALDCPALVVPRHLLITSCWANGLATCASEGEAAVTLDRGDTRHHEGEYVCNPQLLLVSRISAAPQAYTFFHDTIRRGWNHQTTSRFTHNGRDQVQDARVSNTCKPGTQSCMYIRTTVIENTKTSKCPKRQCLLPTMPFQAPNQTPCIHNP